MNIAFFTNKLQSEQGFLLVDVVVAIVILSVALLAIHSLFVQAMQETILARDYTQGSNLARTQCELLKTYPPQYWANLAEPSLMDFQANREEGMSRYSIQTIATPIADEHLVQVVVRANWQERGNEYSVQFLTFCPAL